MDTRETLGLNSTYYHGSPTAGIKQLEPRSSRVLEGGKGVFATADRDTALSFSRRWRDEDIQHGSVNGQMYMKEQYPDAFNKAFNGPGYLYHLEDSGFKSDPRLTRFERISDKTTNVTKVEEIQNVLEALKKSKFQMYSHKEVPPWEKRAYYTPAVQEIKERLRTHMIRQSQPQPGVQALQYGYQHLNNTMDQALNKKGSSLDKQIPQTPEVKQVTRGKTAVIVKGNPLYIKNNPDAHKFYNSLANHLRKKNYVVTFDKGEPYTQPVDADVWIGHSRGADRLRFAPKTTKTIAMGAPYSPDSINHPLDKPEVGKTPEIFHYLLTGKMLNRIDKKLGD